MNRTNITYPCSCENKSEDDSYLVRKGFCEAHNVSTTQSGNSPEDWPVYQEVSGGLWGQGLGLGTSVVQVLGPPRLISSILPFT